MKKINILGKFCGKRDIEELSGQQLKEKYSFKKADVFVLFGGSILAGVGVLAKAVQENIAKNYVIVGGVGHTTEALRQRVHEEYPVIETAGLSEAEVFDRYLKEIYHCDVDIPEEVRSAFEDLKSVYGEKTREANPLFASRKTD